LLTCLEKLYGDMLEVFDNDLFHMGGDEVYQPCWELDEKTNRLLMNGSVTFLDIWGIFQVRGII